MTSRTLITSLYNESKAQRAEELIYCLKHNLKNKLIDNICIVYDGYGDKKDNEIYNLIHNNKDFHIEHCIGKPKFSQLIKIANTHYPGQQIIIANSDIHYDLSLKLLESHDLEYTMLCISRYNQDEYGEWNLITLNTEVPNYFSFDTWIFNSPFKAEIRLDFELGSMFCDSFFARQLYSNSDYSVYNPCLTIKSYHVQKEQSLSQIRSENENKSENNKIWRENYLKHLFSNPISGTIWSELDHMKDTLSTQVSWTSPYNLIYIVQDKKCASGITEVATIANYANKFLWIYASSQTKEITSICDLLGTNVNIINRLPSNFQEYVELEIHDDVDTFISKNHEKHIVIYENSLKGIKALNSFSKIRAKVHIHKYETIKELLIWISTSLEHETHEFIYFSRNTSIINKNKIESIESILHPNMHVILCKTKIELADQQIWHQPVCSNLYDLLRYWEKTMIGLTIENIIFNTKSLKIHLSNNSPTINLVMMILLISAKKGNLVKSDSCISTITTKDGQPAFKWFVNNKLLLNEYLELLPNRLQEKHGVHEKEALKQFDIFNIYEPSN